MRRHCRLVLLLMMAGLLAGQNEPASLRQAAATAFREGRFAEAEVALRRLLGRSPGDPAALSFLAAVLDAQQRYDEAEPILKQALAEAAPSPALLNNAGNHYLARGQPEKGRRYFEQLLTLDPMHQNANLQLARMAVDQKQGAKALEYLARVKDSGPAVVLLRAEALHWAGQRGQAVAVLENLARAGAEDPHVQFSLGMTFARLELYDRAEAAFGAVLARQPDDFAVVYNQGRAAARAEHYERAQRALEVALRLRPDDVDTWFELGRVEAARENYDRAVYVLAKARKLAPRHEGVLLALARVTEDAGYYGDSALAYDEYLRLRPADDSARRDRARVSGYTGTRLDEGIQELNWYIRKHPEDPLGYYKLAELTALRDADQAIELLSVALKLDPNFGPAHYTRAFLLHQSGRTAESVPDLQAAVRSNPKDFRSLDQLGLVYLTLERPAEAEKVLRQALAVAPGKPEVLMHLGRALMDLGRDAEAQRYLEEFKRARQEKPPGPRPNPRVIEFAGLSPAEQKERLTAELRRWILTRPDDPELRLRLGRLLLVQGTADDAAEAFRELLALNPNAKLSQEAGEVLLRSEQYALARDFFRRAVTERPAVRLDLAIALFYTDGPKAALETIDAAPAGSEAGDYLLLRARILAAAGDSEGADRALQEGVRHSTNRPEVAQQAALLLMLHDRNAEALNFLAQALRSAPADPNLLLTQAIALGLTGRTADAENSLKRIAARWPEWDRTFLVHALLLEGRARTAEASQKIRIALALGSRELAARCALARLDGSAAPDPKCDCVRGLHDLLFPACHI